ncbi:CDP-glycerol glycerophosphotransferase family protein [Haliea sp.]|uniref:CDP-glycerol glycerophosphotransferase family protein n=1 Tax=Haliea sp. TaxID=1932666 RepID=UPI003527731B
MLNNFITRSIFAWISENFGPIRVLFPVVNEIGFLNQAPVLALMAHDPRFRVATVNEESVPLIFSADWMQVLFSRHEVSKVQAQTGIWNYVIVTDRLDLWLRWPSLGVYIDHGSAFGNELAQENSVPFVETVLRQSNIDLAFLSGPGHLWGLRDSAPDIASRFDKAMFVSGSPKLVALLEEEVERGTLLSSLGLNPDASTVLISSHWTKMSLLRDLDVACIDSLCENNPNLNVIVTCHPRLLTLGQCDGGDGEWIKRMCERLEAKHHNMAFIRTANPFDLMQVSDCMLCDHSSIRVEYALLMKPVGLYRNPKFKCHSAITDTLYRESSEVFSDPGELNEVVFKLLSPEYGKQRESQKLAGYFLADPALAAPTIVELISQMGRIASSRSKKWRQVKFLEAKKNSQYE